MALSNEQALKNPRVRAFLDMIAFAEGTTKYSYYTLVGNTRLASISQHPNKLVRLRANLSSTAAGRYQFLYRTWQDLKRQNPRDLANFGERAQDIGAIMLLRGCGALDKIERGDTAGAIHVARKIWASFPGAGYGQGERKLSALLDVYNNALGTGNSINTGGAVVVSSNSSDNTKQIAGAVIGFGLIWLIFGRGGA